MKNKKRSIIIFIIILILILAGTLVLALRVYSKKTVQEADSSNTEEEKEKWQEGTVYFNGKPYQYNYAIKTYLFLGIDKEEKVTKAEDGISGGQSDALFLIVEDTEQKKVSLIAINRNAMTTLDIYDKEGNYLGQEEGQICLQHGYGDGEKQSCRRSVDAVSRLFYQLPIQGYISLHMGALPKLNDLAGGIEVEVLQSLKDETRGVDLKEGEQVTLNGQEAYVYLRGRDIDEFDSASMRLERQKQYIAQYGKKAKQKFAEDASFANTFCEIIEDYAVTNIELVELIDEVSEYTFEDEAIYTVPGETVMGEKFEEFEVDDEALYQMIIDIFYKPIEK